MDIEIIYDQLMDKSKQKEYYRAFGKKRHLCTVALGILINVCCGWLIYRGLEISLFLVCEYAVLLIVLIPRMFFWTEYGFYKNRRKLYNKLDKTYPVYLRISNKHIQIVNGVNIFNLDSVERGVRTVYVQIVVETEDKIFLGRYAYAYLCYIDKKTLTPEQYKYVMTALVKAYGKRYKRVM
jgi:hypothetical protein